MDNFKVNVLNLNVDTCAKLYKESKRFYNTFAFAEHYCLPVHIASEIILRGMKGEYK